MRTKGKRKPMTVASILDQPDPDAVASVTVAATAAAAGRGGGQRAHVKQLTLYLPHPVYRQLRELAFHEDRRMHSLLIEGLDRVFADRGARSIAEMTRES